MEDRCTLCRRNPAADEALLSTLPWAADAVVAACTLPPDWHGWLDALDSMERTTAGQPAAVGRICSESRGRPLPGGISIVIKSPRHCCRGGNPALCLLPTPSPVIPAAARMTGDNGKVLSPKGQGILQTLPYGTKHLTKTDQLPLAARKTFFAVGLSHIGAGNPNRDSGRGLMARPALYVGAPPVNSGGAAGPVAP